MSSELLLELASMGNGRRNYEACHNYDKDILLSALHSHDFFEIFLNLRGGRQYVIDDHVYPLGGNDLVIIKPFQIHGHLGVEHLANYDRAFLYVTRKVVDELSQNILPLGSMLEDTVNEGRNVCRITDEQAERFVTLIDAIKDNCDHETAYTRLDDVSLMTQTLLLTLQCVQVGHGEYVPIEEKPQLIQRVINYINDHYDQKLSLDDIAGEFFISKSSLSHRFSQYTSHSLYDYILYCRINRAKLFVANHMPVAEISDQCGFNDYSNFLRTFKRYVGCSPREYKRRLQSGVGLAVTRDIAM